MGILPLVNFQKNIFFFFVSDGNAEGLREVARGYEDTKPSRGIQWRLLPPEQLPSPFDLSPQLLLS